MSPARRQCTCRIYPLLFILPVALALLLIASPVQADDPKTEPVKATGTLELKPVPESVSDLRVIQMRVKKVLKKIIPCTVGVRVGRASGSGVIISKDGYVLTAGHVSGRPNRDVTIILHDGTEVKGKTLGANRGIDSGLMKITDKGEWPYVEMGDAKDLDKGEWVIATGHPTGYHPGRPPVVRLGRVQARSKSVLRTDCTLVGGDSGGPLFDLDGKVVGIHSRIGLLISLNMHVPVNTYKDTWDRLAKAEVWGGRPTVFGNVPYMGVVGDLEAEKCLVTEVIPDSPADNAGLKAEDVILKFGGVEMKKYEDLRPEIRKKKIGDKVKMLVLRDGKEMELEITLGRRDR